MDNKNNSYQINNKTIDEKKFYSEYEAVSSAIFNSEKTHKQVASELWPSLPFYTAYQKLIDALNPEKRQKLTLDEIILICKICKRDDPLFYMCESLSYSQPQKKYIESEIDFKVVERA